MITVVDYGSGNLRSVQKAFEKLGAAARITADPQVVAESERLVLPGVGAFGDAMRALRDQATETARRILALREDHRTAVTTHLARAAANGHRVLEHLYERPIVSVGQIQALLGTTYPAANNVVKRLATLGILREITGYHRNRLFRYESYIRLFSETQAEPG